VHYHLFYPLPLIPSRQGRGVFGVCGKKGMLEYKSPLGYVHPGRKNGALTPLFL
jgi:hypothetical protein